MHYLNATFDFWGNSLLKKGMYRVIEHIFAWSNKSEVLLIYCSFSFFLKDKKLKKLAVALKFLYFLTDLSLNSNAFC